VSLTVTRCGLNEPSQVLACAFGITRCAASGSTLRGSAWLVLLLAGTGVRNYINVVAVVLDNVNLGPVVTYELLAEFGRNGFAGKAYRMSDGGEEIRAGLAEYLLPGAVAA
jgi:hypothetical protein